MSEQKERGDIEQALNELEEATRLGVSEGIKAAHKRLDAYGVSVKRRAGRLRQVAAEESEVDEPTVVKVEKSDPKSVPPVERKAPGPTSKV